MLRRPPTTINLTADDVHAYHARLAARRPSPTVTSSASAASDDLDDTFAARDTSQPSATAFATPAGATTPGAPQPQPRARPAGGAVVTPTPSAGEGMAAAPRRPVPMSRHERIVGRRDAPPRGSEGGVR